LIDIDPEGNKMIMKWKSIYSLQKKITNLEEKVQSLEEELSKSSNGRTNQNVKIEDLYIPKAPAK
jgi:septal ring factor EnvC (AmiA/AmiB activator)